MFCLENFQIPEELRLFVDDGLAEEINDYKGLMHSKSTMRIWLLKNSNLYYIMSGIDLRSVNDQIYAGGVIANWADSSLRILTMEEVFDACIENFELTSVLVSRPDIYFSNNRTNRRFILENDS